MTAFNLYFFSALIVGILFPVYAIWNGKKTKQIITNHPEAKTTVFKQTGLILLFLTFLSILPFWVYEKNLETIGLNFLNKPFWVIGLFVISIVVLLALKSVRLNLKSATKFYEANKTIQFLLPITKEELNITVIISFIAGICEEIIYRGFLFWYLSQYMPLLVAMTLANIPFALGHLTTTGTKNTFGALILAFIFSGAYYITGSLWLPILLHIIVDLYSMIFAHKAYHIIQDHQN